MASHSIHKRAKRALSRTFGVALGVQTIIATIITGILACIGLGEWYMNYLPLLVLPVIILLTFIILYVRSLPPISSAIVTVKMDGYSFDETGRLKLGVNVGANEDIYVETFELKIGRKRIPVESWRPSPYPDKGFLTSIWFNTSSYRSLGEKEVQLYAWVNEEPWRSRKAVIDFGLELGGHSQIKQ